MLGKRGLWAVYLVTLATAARAKPSVPAQDLPAAPAEAPLEAGGVLEARDAFRLGSTLAKQGQWSEALSAFQRSAELKPHPVTTYDIGYCQRALGRPASAYESFSVALEWTASADVLPDDIAAQARAFASEVLGRIVRVSAALPAEGLSLRVDGAGLRPFRDDPGRGVYLVRAAESATAKLPVHVELWLDPGPHVFVLTHTDGSRAVENRTLAPGAHESLAFGAAAPARVEPPPVVPPPPPPDAEPAKRAPDRTAAWISFGVAAAGLGTSAVFAALALEDKKTLMDDPRCKDQLCPSEPYYDDLQSRMITRADVATVGIAVFGAASLLGTYFWVTAKPPTDAPRGGAGVRAFVGLGSAGVSGRF
jgi:hypothetical protein